MTKFCHKCNRATQHRRLKKTGFFTQCLASVICFAVIGEGAGHSEPDWECLGCGVRSEGD